MIKLHRYTLSELENLAKKMSKEVEPPYTILLYGGIGAGKTTFSQFFIDNISTNPNEKVTSPTFNLVQIYDTTKGPVWHVDLYRLQHKEELFQLGIIEAMHESICLIEWPHILEEFITNVNHVKLNLEEVD